MQPPRRSSQSQQCMYRATRTPAGCGHWGCASTATPATLSTTVLQGPTQPPLLLLAVPPAADHRPHQPQRQQCRPAHQVLAGVQPQQAHRQGRRWHTRRCLLRVRLLPWPSHKAMWPCHTPRLCWPPWRRPRPSRQQQWQPPPQRRRRQGQGRQARQQVSPKQQTGLLALCLGYRHTHSPSPTLLAVWNPPPSYMMFVAN